MFLIDILQTHGCPDEQIEERIGFDGNLDKS